MILQDPMSSLNPVFSIGMQMREPRGDVPRPARPRARRAGRRAAGRGAHPVARRARCARSRTSSRAACASASWAPWPSPAPPRLLIADEPTTSLDLTIQAQYLGLLKELQERHRLAMIFVTHNLGIVARMCDRVAVMYAGRIVESGPVRADLHGARASLHAGAARVDPAPGRAERDAPDRHRRPAARPRDAAGGLRVRAALRARDGPLPRRRRRPRRGRARPRHALLAEAPERVGDVASAAVPLLEGRPALVKHFPPRTSRGGRAAPGSAW